MRWTTHAVHASKAIAAHANETRVTVIHAHDLYCALAVVLAKPSSSFYFIYDAHELEIQRNRKSGWLRTLLEHGIEQWVLREASEVRVVNRAIAEVMEQWYQMPRVVRVEYNGFYRHHPARVPPAAGIPVFAYVGKGVNGRQLEVLDRPAGELGFEVHVFLLGADLPRHIRGIDWHHGPHDYEQHLLNLAHTRRCLMWCCLDATCLSYQLAIPNKFFQALAVGMPIVAMRGTYLAEIVDKYELGVIFDGTNLRDIRKEAMSPIFEKWVARVAAFREDLREGRAAI